MSQEFAPDETNHPAACDALIALSSEIVIENARFCLRHSAYPELWTITCGFCEGVLTMEGIVGSYFLKQLARAAVLGIEGVEEIADRLQVVYPTGSSNDTHRRPK